MRRNKIARTAGKRGSVLQIGDTWYIKYSAGHLPNGRPRQIKRAIPEAKTQRDAQRALTAALAAVDAGHIPEPIRNKAHMVAAPAPSQTCQTVGELAERYLKHSTDRLEAGTHRNYELVIRKHIVPTLGTVLLTELTGMRIQEIYKSFIDAGLKPKTVKNLHSILHRMLELACRWGLLERNAADGLELPKNTYKPVTCTNSSGVRAIIKAANDAGMYRIPVIIVCYTGMRRGEIVGLRWGDFDRERKTITVQRSIAVVSGRGGVIKPPKTDRIRIVDIPDTLCELLIGHREATQYNADDDYICTRPDGSHLSLKEFSLKFRDIAKTAGLLDLRLHDLRHSMVTMLLDSGVAPYTVAARTGHSIHTMQTVYAHATPQTLRHAADTVNDLLG